MKNLKIVINTSVLVLVIIFSINTLGYGNAAEPPSILFIVPNAPDDMNIKLKLGGREYEAKVVDKIIEKYYIFYSSDMMRNKPDIYNFIVNTENESFEIERVICADCKFGKLDCWRISNYGVTYIKW